MNLSMLSRLFWGSSIYADRTDKEWMMLLKQVPDNVFIDFFEDNPEMRYVAEEYEEPDRYISPEDRKKMNDEINTRRSKAMLKFRSKRPYLNLDGTFD
jgi:hypothetical protein